MTHSALYLTFINKSHLAVKVQLTNDGLLVQAIDRPDISFIIGGLTALQAVMQPRVERCWALDPLGLSPADVVRYFQQSPVLSIYAEDVRTAVLGHPEVLQGDFQLQQDLDDVKGLVSPSLADLSEKLTGNRYYSGRTYKRVKQVYEALYSSSSEEKGRIPKEEEAKAA